MDQTKISVIGEVSIDVIDVNTNQVIRTITENNDLTKNGFSNLTAGALFGGGYTFNFLTDGSNMGPGNTYPPDPGGDNGKYARVVVSSYRLSKPVFFEQQLPSATGPNAYVNDWAAVHDEAARTITKSVKCRFNPPAQNREIWSIALQRSRAVDGSSGTAGDLITVCALNSACTQSTNEILDVTYKVVFTYAIDSNLTYDGSMPVSDLYSMSRSLQAAWFDVRRVPNSLQFMPNLVHKTKHQYRSWGVPYATTGTSAYNVTFPHVGGKSMYDGTLMKAYSTKSWDITEGVGHLIRSVCSMNYGDANFPASNTYSRNFGFFGKLANPGFLNAPIQPIHSHNSVSTVPFMDATNPGSSAGSISIVGQNWTKKEAIPEYYRINCTKTGAVGTSNYYFSNRLLTGFDGNTYNSASYDLAFTERNTTLWYGKEQTTLVGMHGSSLEDPCDWEEYSDTKFVLFDDTGISIIDISNGDAATFDVGTTPALPVTKVAQVAVKFSNKDVWVACSNTGLYKIQNAFTTPTVTKITSINGTAVNACYAVSLGNNGSIVCAYANGLAITSDDGSSWTTYNDTTPQKFEYNAPSTTAFSTEFNGTSSVIQLPVTQNHALSTGDFTIEGWFWFDDATANSNRAMVTSGYASWESNNFFFGKNTSYGGRVSFWVAPSGVVADSTLPPENKWVHYAVSRNGNTFRLFRDGVLVGTGTSTDAVTATTLTQGLMIGREGAGTFFDGKMYNVKITKGLGKYTSNFSVATELAPNTDANTVLLTCVNSAIDDQSGLSIPTTPTACTTASLAINDISPFKFLDNVWSRIKLIRTDIQSVDNEMLVMFNYSTERQFNSFWWSTTKNSSAGPILGTEVAMTNSVLGGTSKEFSRYWSARCSHYGSMWVGGIEQTDGVSYPSTRRQNLHILKFGNSSSVLNLNAGDGGSYTTVQQNVNISFYYDYYKNPYVAVIRAFGVNGYSIKTIYLCNSRGVLIGYSDFNSRVGLSWDACHGSLGFNASYHCSPLIHSTAGGKAGDKGQNGFVRVIAPYIGGSDPYGYTTITGFVPDAYNGRYSPFEEFVWKKYHWNTSSNQWQSGYYSPAIDYSQYATSAARHNFDAESHFFTGRSLVDVTNTFKLGASTGTQATFAFTVNSSAKLTSVFQEATSTLFSLDNSTNLFRIVWNGGVNFEIHHGTWASPTVTGFGAALANGTSHRIVVTLDGTSCVVYANGAQLGSVTMASPVTLSAIDYAYIGAAALNGSLTTKTPHPFSFFRGTLTNIQLWKATWSGSDVTADYADQSQTIGTIPASSLLAHFKLNETLVETKPTNATVDALNDGITIKFNNNATDPTSSFISGDFYTFGVVDGMLKDNAMTFTYNNYDYGHVNADGNFTGILNSLGTNVIQAPATITAPVSVVKTSHSASYYSTPGYFVRHASAASPTSGVTESGVSNTYPAYDGIVISYQTAQGDFTLSFRHNKPIWNAYGIGMTNWFVPSYNGEIPENLSMSSASEITHATQQNSAFIQNARFVFSSDYKVTIEEWHNDSVFRRLITPVTANIDDVFEVRRTGTTMTYYINSQLVYTSPRTFTTAAMTMRADSNNIEATITGTWSGSVNDAFPHGFCDIELTHTEPKNMMYIGNAVNGTGCFGDRFLGVDVHPTVDSTVKIYLNGVLAPVTVVNDYLDRISIPAAGAVILVKKAGILVFNPADVGKTVTGSVTAVSFRS